MLCPAGRVFDAHHARTRNIQGIAILLSYRTLQKREERVMVRTMAFASSVFSWLCFSSLVAGIPMQVVVNQRATECIYDKVDADEYVTMSVFILAGSELKATAKFEGPVADNDVNSGKDLQDKIADFEKGKTFGKTIVVEKTVDFEHLLEDDYDDYDYDEDYEDDYGDGVDDDESQVHNDKRQEIYAKRKAHHRDIYKKNEKKHSENQEKNIRDEGAPFERTVQAKTAGWYRLCVRGTWYQITVEMEMRREKDLGGRDTKTGHVWTYEKKTTLQEEKYLNEDTAKEEEGILDEDFEKTRDQLRKLRNLLSEIQSKQMNERHRLAVHTATNEHSHSRMVMGSLFETILFMAVTGFQIFTIRKWFSGASVLGR